jgi:hypothetical protein
MFHRRFVRPTNAFVVQHQLRRAPLFLLHLRLRAGEVHRGGGEAESFCFGDLLVLCAEQMCHFSLPGSERVVDNTVDACRQRSFYKSVLAKDYYSKANSSKSVKNKAKKRDVVLLLAIIAISYHIISLTHNK